MSYDSITDGQKKIIIILILTAVILVLYWQVHDFEFLNYDDQLYVTSNDLTQSTLNLRNVGNVFADTQTGNWHPLTMLSHMLDWQFYQWKAGGHHWTNVIFHILNTILLFLLFHRLTGAVWRSGFIAALFALHPINVESVAWIAERKNVLSTFFWIATMYLYIRYTETPECKRYIPMLICFVLGLMSKAMLVTLPFVLLLMDFWPLNRTPVQHQPDRSIKKVKMSFLVLEKIPLLILSIIFVYITIYAQKTMNAFDNPAVLPLVKRITNALVAYCLYLRKFIWPTDLQVFYPFNSIPLWQIILSVVLLAMITFSAFKNIKKHPYFAVGWLWYLGTLIPVIGLVQVGRQSMADRYAYVPFIGLFLMTAWMIPQIASKLRYSKISIPSACIIFLMIMAFSSFNRISAWQNTRTLFGEAIRVNPHNYFAYNILGLEEAGQEHYEKALYYYHESLRINPNNDQAFNNAGNAFLKLGNYKEAYHCYQNAISINEKQSMSWHNLGVLFAINGRYDEAILCFNKTLAMRPDEINAHMSMGTTLLKTGKVEGAIYHFKKVIRLNPQNAAAQKGLQDCYRITQKHQPE